MTQDIYKHVVITAYGEVVLSEKTLRWLDWRHPGWCELMKKKRRSKKRDKLMRTIAKLQMATSLIAEIAWHDGEVLERL